MFWVIFFLNLYLAPFVILQPSTVEQCKIEQFQGSACRKAGRFQMPGDCNKYIRCVNIGGSLFAYNIKCPGTSFFNEEKERCEYARTCPQDVRKKRAVSRKNTRIFGGVPILNTTYSYTVIIRGTGERRTNNYCSGALISSIAGQANQFDQIITSLNCLEVLLGRVYAADWINTEAFELTAGVTNITDLNAACDPPNCVQRQLSVAAGPDANNEIIRLNIDGGAIPSGRIRVIRTAVQVPNQGTPEGNGILSGYGASYLLSPQNNGTLHVTCIKIYTRRECSSKFGLTTTAGTFCAGLDDNSSGGCSGDAGAPLICPTDDGDNWYLCGILISTDERCRYRAKRQTASTAAISLFHSTHNLQ